MYYLFKIYKQSPPFNYALKASFCHYKKSGDCIK